MPDGGGSLLARTIGSINDIEANLWDELANPPGDLFNPFVSHAFLAALEESKSVAPETGWAPQHLIVEDNGRIAAAAPLYLKGHSQGEYIFDHHWADAYERAGGRYYPKLLCAVPFTPTQGPRLLARSETDRNHLAAALRSCAERMEVSSAHVNFVTETDQNALTANGFLPRIGEQFHWFNRGYTTFEEFLGALSSRKRKVIRRERRDAGKSGVIIHRLLGANIEDRHWRAFWRFYQDTGARKWGHPYLSQSFFKLLAERMPERLLFIVAERDEIPVAGALNLIGGDALYGRYWGCTEEIPFMHFEICYYQAIEFAIERGLSRVEAGAQGEHKIARGYEPVTTRSAHWIGDKNFSEAISNYLDAERQQTGMEIEAMRAYMPYKQQS